MPIPKPGQNESKDDFIGRCMSNDAMNSEYPERDQRFAICMDSWRTKSKMKYSKDISSSIVTEKGDWVVTAYASTFEVNSYNIQITRQALENAQTDFKTYSTILFNHDQNIPVGHVVATEVDDKGLKLTIIVSKTCEDLWNKIQDGTISKMSIYGEYSIKDDSILLPNLGITQITKIKFYEASFVSVPGDGAAQIEESYIASKEINNSDSMVDIKDKLKEIADMSADDAKTALNSLLDQIEADDNMNKQLLDNLKLLAGKLSGADIELMNNIIMHVEMLLKKKCKTEMASDEMNDEPDMTVDDEVDLNDESENRPVLQLTDNSALESQGTNHFKKQILKIGKWYHNSAPGGVLNVTTELITNIVKNFNAGIIENVFVPLTHTDDPTKNTGSVVELIQTDKGLDAIIEVKDNLVAEKIKNDLIRCISASIDSNYRVKTTGKYVGPTLLHAAFVAEPYIKGMDRFVPLSDEFAGRPVYAFDDSEQVKSDESIDSTVEQTEDKNKDMITEDKKTDAVVDENTETTAEVAEEAVTEEVETPENGDETVTETVDAAEEESVDETVEEQTEEDVDLSDVNGAYESLLKAGKIVPAQKDAFVQLFGSMKKTISLADDSTISFSDALGKFFALQPKVVDFSEDGVADTTEPVIAADTDTVPTEVADFYRKNFDLDDDGIKAAWKNVQELAAQEKDNKSTLF